MKLKEHLTNLFWRLILPIFRLKWWISNRGERKRFRERQKWEYILHSYETCMFYHISSWNDEENKIGICNRPIRFLPIRRLFWAGSIYPECKKSKNCKYYVHDPLKRTR